MKLFFSRDLYPRFSLFSFFDLFQKRKKLERLDKGFEILFSPIFEGRRRTSSRANKNIEMKTMMKSHKQVQRRIRCNMCNNHKLESEFYDSNLKRRIYKCIPCAKQRIKMYQTADRLSEYHSIKKRSKRIEKMFPQEDKNRFRKTMRLSLSTRSIQDLVERVFDGKSVISGSSESLVLVRMDCSRSIDRTDNCILLTSDEADFHLKSSNRKDLYPVLFIEHVKQLLKRTDTPKKGNVVSHNGDEGDKSGVLGHNEKECREKDQIVLLMDKIDQFVQKYDGIPAY